MNDEDKLEILEFYVGLLAERVENFNKEKSASRIKLNEFICEYIDLEDKILNLMEKLSQANTENNPDLMEGITFTFNKYWGDYQDEWSDEYWDVYNMFRHVNDKELFSQLNKKTFTSKSNNSFFEENIEKVKDGKNGEKFNHSPNKGIKQRTKSASTNEDSFCQNMSLINLNKIDEEMEKVDEVSIIKEKQKEKRRNCFDCSIF
jgi:hypothetical protein